MKRMNVKVQSKEIFMELHKTGIAIMEDYQMVEDFEIKNTKEGKILEIKYKKEYRNENKHNA